MPPCRTCVHPKLEEIEKRQAAGEPLRQLKARFPGLSTGGLSRHFSRCVKTRRWVEREKRKRVEKGPAAARAESRKLASPIPEAIAERPDDVVELMRVDALRDRALALLEQAERTGDGRLAVSSIREIRQLIELEGRFTGKIQRPEPAQGHSAFFIFPAGSEPIINLGPGDRAQDRQSDALEAEARDITPEGGD